MRFVVDFRSTHVKIEAESDRSTRLNTLPRHLRLLRPQQNVHGLLSVRRGRARPLPMPHAQGAPLLAPPKRRLHRPQLPVRPRRIRAADALARALRARRPPVRQVRLHRLQQPRPHFQAVPALAGFDLVVMKHFVNFFFFHPVQFACRPKHLGDASLTVVLQMLHVGSVGVLARATCSRRRSSKHSAGRSASSPHSDTSEAAKWKAFFSARWVHSPPASRSRSPTMRDSTENACSFGHTSESKHSMFFPLPKDLKKKTMNFAQFPRFTFDAKIAARPFALVQLRLRTATRSPENGRRLPDPRFARCRRCGARPRCSRLNRRRCRWMM